MVKFSYWKATRKGTRSEADAFCVFENLSTSEIFLACIFTCRIPQELGKSRVSRYQSVMRVVLRDRFFTALYFIYIRQAGIVGLT